MYELAIKDLSLFQTPFAIIARHNITTIIFFE